MLATYSFPVARKDDGIPDRLSELLFLTVGALLKNRKREHLTLTAGDVEMSAPTIFQPITKLPPKTSLFF